MHVARWDILLVTKYVQVKGVLNVVIEDTGQLVVGVRLRVRRVVRRVAEGAMGERVAINRDIPGIPSLLRSRFLGCHATLPPKKRLLTTEQHSFLIVFVFCLRSVEQTNHIAAKSE